MDVAMKQDHPVVKHVRPDARSRLLERIPLTERRLELAGISTALLEGGEGSPLVLLHGPGACAAKWFTIVPQLLQSHRLIVPDLPGHGTSIVPEGAVEADRVLDWLDALIGATCPRPAALVGQIVGGAIAARFASRLSGRLSRLVLCDTLGLVPFAPDPAFGRALAEFSATPDQDTHDGLWRQCAFDLGSLRKRLGTDWELMKAYNIDRARTTSLHATQQSLMQRFGLPAIARAELERITAPTTLIWGRHDRATPVSVAEAASERYGWPLHIIDGCADDPPFEQPAAFLDALRSALNRP